MTQPVQFRQSILIAFMMGAQAVLPAIVAVASLYATIILFRQPVRPALLGHRRRRGRLPGVDPAPREVTAQLTSPRVSAVVDVIFRWFLILGLLLGIAYVTKSPLQTYPRRVFLTWATFTPVLLIVATLGMQEFMRRFLMNAFDVRTAIIAGYNASSLELARRLKKNPGMRSRSPDSSTTAAPTGSVWSTMRRSWAPLGDLGAYVKEHRTDVIFIALPIRHVQTGHEPAG